MLKVTANKPPDSLTDDNECESGTDECPADAKCKNMVSGYTCVCGAGFAFDKKSNSCRGKNFKLFTPLKVSRYNIVIILAKRLLVFKQNDMPSLVLLSSKISTVLWLAVKIC